MFDARAAALLLAMAWTVAAVRPAPAADAVPVPYGDGLLWRIEGAGATPSRLFGTMHRAGPQALEPPPDALAALARSRTAGFEVLLTAAAFRALAEASRLPEARRLEDIVGSGLFERTAALMQPYRIDRAALQSLKPWAVATALLSPPPGPFDPVPEPMDARLQDAARAQGLDLFALETAGEQIAMFDGLGDAAQRALLAAAVDDHPGLEAEIARLARAYQARDTATLYRRFLEGLATLDGATRHLFQARFLADRNRVMVERMLPRLESGGAFIAVGALHLPGADGILRLLADRGFTLVRED